MAINGLRTGTRRDTQRSKVYAAEAVIVSRGARGRTPDPRFAEIADCQSYVDRLTRSDWYRRTFPTHAGRAVTVKHGGGSGSARASGTRLIELPAWSRQKSVILHELAHLIVTATHRSAAWHGWEFCAVYLQLVRHEMGTATEAKLKASFKEHRVRFRAPRKMTDEQRQAAASRLASYRATFPQRAAACETPSRELALALARANQC